MTTGQPFTKTGSGQTLEEYSKHACVFFAAHRGAANLSDGGGLALTTLPGPPKRCERPRNAHAMPTQCPRNAHAMPTQCPRNAHAMPTQFPRNAPQRPKVLSEYLGWAPAAFNLHVETPILCFPGLVVALCVSWLTCLVCVWAGLMPSCWQAATAR
jgi:hypothetical protein